MYRLGEHSKRADGWKPLTICSTRVKSLFPSTRGGERGGESREFHRVGTGESSPSTTTNTNSSFATCLPQIGHLQKYVDQKLVETSSKFSFFPCKT